MEIEPCPHCYRKVIPMANDLCPACGKNTKDRTNTDPNKVLVGIRSGQQLPAVCHACGTATRATQKISASLEPRDGLFSDGLLELFAHSVIPFGFAGKMERAQKTTQVSVRLPTCKKCNRILGRITPHYIDFDAHRIDLIVHVEFKRAVEGSERQFAAMK